MSLRAVLRRPRTWLIAVPVVVLLVAVVGPFVYINFIQDDPPERLSFEDATTTTEPDGGTSSSSSSSTATSAAPATGGAIDGTWAVGGTSQVGYRVGEVLFGQDTEAVGRTSAVTGDLSIDGTTVAAASFTVDLTTVASDESRRDGQFQGRIMDTASFPTATFTLTQPIELGAMPADLEEVTVEATGDLTVRGATNPVTFSLTARRNGTVIEVNGAIPLVFADFGIPDASFGPATVQDHGELEFLLVFERA